MSAPAGVVARGVAAGSLSLPWVIAASSVGTLIEWYDFYLYGVSRCSSASISSHRSSTRRRIYPEPLRLLDRLSGSPFRRDRFRASRRPYRPQFTFMLTLGRWGPRPSWWGCCRATRRSGRWLRSSSSRCGSSRVSPSVAGLGGRRPTSPSTRRMASEASTPGMDSDHGDEGDRLRPAGLS